MPLDKSGSKAAFSNNVRAERMAGKPLAQSLAIAYRVQRGHANGGVAGSTPFYVRSAAHSLERSGFIHSTIPGRTDRIGAKVSPGSYVFPADVVSGTGRGNSLAGANTLNRMFKMGPYGSSPSLAPHASPPPRFSMQPLHLNTRGMMQGRRGFADGGSSDPVDIIVSGGEFIVPQHKVAEIGGGDIDMGHEILDRFVKHVRSKTINRMSNLPNPQK
jgi:hypothetical protein